MADARANGENLNPTSSSAAGAALSPTPTNEGDRNGTGLGAGSGTEQSEPTPPLAALARHTGHELPFVAPSSYLRPKSNSRTMSDKTATPLDREQMQGLVSKKKNSLDSLFPTWCARASGGKTRRRSRHCANPSYRCEPKLLLTFDLSCHVERCSRVSQGPN